jgi:hypothetical protein
MRFVYWPTRIRCFACERIGPSRVSAFDRLLPFLPLPLLAVFAWSGSWDAAAIALVASLIALFRRRAHRCAACGSEFTEDV